MPEFTETQVKMLALDHAIKIAAPGAQASDIIEAAREFEQYIRGVVPYRETETN